MADLNYPSRTGKDNQRIPNRDINAAQRAVMAVQLRAQKITFEQIAKQCGYTSASACRKAILREMDRVVVKNVEQLRAEEAFMLDQLHQECWLLAMDRKNQWRLQAVDRLLSISERRAKLMGLDTPVDSALMSNMVVVREIPQGLLSAGEVKP